MENKGVDNIIKQKLQNFEVDLNPTDWQFMEEMLAAEESDVVDEVAKDKLQQHEVPFDATGWAAMNFALDDLAEAEAVDEVVKKNLEPFEVPYKAADWSVMAAILDTEMPDETPSESIQETNEIDELARAALANFTVPFSLSEWEMMDMELDDLGFPHEADEAAKTALKNYETAMPSDWTAMETALLSAERMRRQLIITKSIEVALFIFAIWTIGNFLPFKNENSSTIINSVEKIESGEIKPQANADVIDVATINSSEVKNNDLDNNSTIDNSNDYVEQLEQNNRLPNLNRILPLLKDSEELPVSTRTEKPIANLNTIPLEEQLVTYPNGKGAIFGQAKLNQATQQAVFLDTKQFALATNEFLPSSTANSNYQKNELRFRVATSPQYAFFSNKESINNRKIASGLATTVGIDYSISDKVELSSGITYNRKSYIQQQQQEFTNAYNQFTLNSVKDIALEIIQIPIHANYNVIKNDKTRLYITGGATAGLIMKVDNSTQQISLANSVSNFNADVASASTSSLKTEGALQNGEITTNTFITGDIGIGLEYQATRRLSFFIEPLFQRSLNKIGVDEEDYQNYALSVGSRVIL